MKLSDQVKLIIITKIKLQLELKSIIITRKKYKLFIQSQRFITFKLHHKLNTYKLHQKFMSNTFNLPQKSNMCMCITHHNMEDQSKLYCKMDPDNKD